jgi:hypothetical protein
MSEQEIVCDEHVHGRHEARLPDSIVNKQQPTDLEVDVQSFERQLDSKAMP